MSDYYRPVEAVWNDTPLGRLAQAATESPRARRTDPETSQEAAAAVADFEGDHYAQIIDALRIGPAGATEIASRCGLGRDAVGKRMVELERRGLVVIEGKVRNAKGRNEARYRRANRGQ